MISENYPAYSPSLFLARSSPNLALFYFDATFRVRRAPRYAAVHGDDTLPVHRGLIARSRALVRTRIRVVPPTNRPISQESPYGARRCIGQTRERYARVSEVYHGIQNREGERGRENLSRRPPCGYKSSRKRIDRGPGETQREAGGNEGIPRRAHTGRPRVFSCTKFRKQGGNEFPLGRKQTQKKREIDLQDVNVS